MPAAEALVTKAVSCLEGAEEAALDICAIAIGLRTSAPSTVMVPSFNLSCVINRLLVGLTTRVGAPP
jgi:hypothetical protein